MITPLTDEEVYRRAYQRAFNFWLEIAGSRNPLICYAPIAWWHEVERRRADLDSLAVEMRRRGWL